MSEKTNVEHAVALLAIYENRPQNPGNFRNGTALGIINYLNGDDREFAVRLFENDGDKLPSYTKWGAAFETYLYQHIGCRGHRVTNCQNWLCAAMAQDRARHMQESK